MDLVDITDRIASGFLTARSEPLKAHPLAEEIRSAWPTAAKDAIDPKWVNVLTIKGSPGLGRWSEAPWLAFLHKNVTRTARSGFYPLFLFEPGFKTYCLVLAQGTDQLRETFGVGEAQRVVRARAGELRSAARGWKSVGFSEGGEFRTFSRLASAANDKVADADGWGASVAFGKRYHVADLSVAASITTDLERMLEIYDDLARTIGDRFSSVDAAAQRLEQSGELPHSGFDGATKVIAHKKLEREIRLRNSKLARSVKSVLGYRCQGCAIDLLFTYQNLGNNFIEAHHLRPLSEAPREGLSLTVQDFAVLCPTCHRVIHRMGCPTLEEFVESISSSVREFHVQNGGKIPPKI